MDFSVFFQHSAEPSLILGTHRHVERANRAAERVLGYDAGTLDGLKLEDIVHPSDHRLLDDFLDRCKRVSKARSGALHMLETFQKFVDHDELPEIYESFERMQRVQRISSDPIRILHNDGSPLLYRWSSVTDPHESCHFIHLEKVVRQSTSETFDVRLQRASEIGSWTYYVEQDRTVGTPYGYELLGLDPEADNDLQTTLDALEPEYHDLVMEKFEALVKDDIPYDIEVRGKERNGVRPWVRLVAMRDEDPATGQIVVRGTIQRIDVIKEMSRKLERTEAQTNMLIKYVPAAVAITDEEFRYIAVSDRWIEDYGLDPDDLIGRSHHDVFPDLPQDWIDKQFQVMQEHEPLLNQEDRWDRADGSVLYINGEIRPWFKESGRVGGLIFFTQVVNRDVERKNQLQDLVDELSRSNADLEQFAYVSSHDLQEPMRMIRAYSDLLKNTLGEDIGEKEREYLVQITESSQRMQAMVQNLLQYSRVNRTEALAETFSPAEVIETKLSDLRLMIDECHASIQTGEMPDILEFDRHNFGLIMNNLISNALKYNDKEQPIVRIEGTTTDDGYRFSVSDNGMGIGDTDQGDRIYNIFQRLPEHRSIEGSGLGLAIVKKILDRHRGRIWFESEPGEGTTFFFEIPRIPVTQPYAIT